MAERQLVTLPHIEKMVNLFEDTCFGSLENTLITSQTATVDATCIGHQGFPSLKTLLAQKITLKDLVEALPELTSTAAHVIAFDEESLKIRIPALEVREWVSCGRPVVRLDAATQDTLSRGGALYTGQAVAPLLRSFIVELSEPILIGTKSLPCKHIFVTRFDIPRSGESAGFLVRTLTDQLTDYQQISRGARADIVMMRKNGRWNKAQKLLEKQRRELKEQRLKGNLFAWCILVQTQQNELALWQEEQADEEILDLLRFSLNLILLLNQRITTGELKLPSEPYPFEIGDPEDILKVYAEDAITLYATPTPTPETQGEVSTPVAQLAADIGVYHPYSYGRELPPHDTARQTTATNYLTQLAARLRRNADSMIVQKAPRQDDAMRAEYERKRQDLGQEIQIAEVDFAESIDRLTAQISKPVDQLCRVQSNTEQDLYLAAREHLGKLKESLEGLEKEIAQVTSERTREIGLGLSQANASVIETTIELLGSHQLSKVLSCDMTSNATSHNPLPESWKTMINNRKLSSLLGTQQDADAMRCFLRAMHIDFGTAIESMLIRRSALYAQAQRLKSAKLVAGLTSDKIDHCVKMIDGVVASCCDAHGFSLSSLNDYIVSTDEDRYAWNRLMISQYGDGRKGDLNVQL